MKIGEKLIIETILLNNILDVEIDTSIKNLIYGSLEISVRITVSELIYDNR